MTPFMLSRPPPGRGLVHAPGHTRPLDSAAVWKHLTNCWHHWNTSRRSGPQRALRRRRQARQWPPRPPTARPGPGDGHVGLPQRVDPPGDDQAALLQRTGLTLDNGRVVFGMGGITVTARATAAASSACPKPGRGRNLYRGQAPGQSQGAVWMGGAAPVVAAGANVWVSVGNGSVTSPTSPFDHSDSLLELSPTMTLLPDLHRPIGRPTTPTTSTCRRRRRCFRGPVIAAGKSRIVYPLDGAALRGTGRRLIAPDACNGRHRRRRGRRRHHRLPALSQRDDCHQGVPQPPPGLAETDLGAPRSGVDHPSSPEDYVWTIGQDGTLFGFDPSTGALREHAVVGAPADHFPTPSVGAGRLLAASADHVIAFTMSSTSSTATSASSSTTTTVARSTTTSSAPAGGRSSSEVGSR